MRHSCVTPASGLRPVYRINQLYYITPVQNIVSILERGILSHDTIEKEGIQYYTIYDKDVLAHRLSKVALGGRRLTSYANFYFQPSNSMLFSLVKKYDPDSIVVVGVSPTILKTKGVLITNGNAANNETMIFPVEMRSEVLGIIKDVLESETWSPDQKRSRMAECLYPDRVPPDKITRIYVRGREAKTKLLEHIAGTGFSGNNVVIESRMFFDPYREFRTGKHVIVRDGDMFQSRMQTMTIPVNCVGAMAGGQASTVRYYFPEVYVKYKELCDRNVLRLGQPYLYKRKVSYELLDYPFSANENVWFLLFPTKDHFKNPASLEGIDRGLQWLEKSYRREGIESIALPALGCGKGWLRWDQVWPIMRRHLSNFEVPVEVYLPLESVVPDSQIS